MKKINERSRKGNIGIAVAIIGVIALAVLIIFLTVGRPLISLVSDPPRFRAWVDARGILGKLFYVGMMFLQVVVAVLPGEPFEIAAGYAFGMWEGTLLCFLGAILGSTAVFWLVRRFGRRLVCLFFSEEKLESVRFLQTSPKRNYLFFIIFLIPGTPKDLLCYFAGLTDMKFGTWMLISSVGRIPSLVSSTVGGDALGNESYLTAIIIFAVTLAISGVGILIYHLIQRAHSKQKSNVSDMTE